MKKSSIDTPCWVSPGKSPAQSELYGKTRPQLRKHRLEQHRQHRVAFKHLRPYKTAVTKTNLYSNFQYLSFENCPNRSSLRPTISGTELKQQFEQILLGTKPGMKTLSAFGKPDWAATPSMPAAKSDGTICCQGRNLLRCLQEWMKFIIPGESRADKYKMIIYL